MTNKRSRRARSAVRCVRLGSSYANCGDTYLGVMSGHVALHSWLPGRTMRMSELPEKRNAHSVAVETLGLTFAAILGLAAGPAAPLLTAALTPAATRLMEQVAAEWTRKGGIVAQAALSSSELNDPEEFCEILSGDPELIALVQKIVSAAAESGNGAKLRALGALLGGAVARRGDRVDETQLLTAALAAIETPHIVVLDLLMGPAPDDEKYREKAASAEAARTREGRPGNFTIPPHRDSGEAMSGYEPSAWLPEQIQEESPMEPGFALACLSVLSGHNLIKVLGTYGGGSRYKITDFGRALIKVMRQVAEPAES